MPWNDPRIPTRSSRNKSHRMNRLLNWAIGIVSVAIIFVGGYLLYSVMNPSSKSATAHTVSKQSKGSSNQSPTSKSGGSTKNKQSNSSTNANSKSSQTDTSSSTAASDSKQSSQANSQDAYHFVGGGPNGPWEPIGTVQSEPHTTNYDTSSVDWQERIKALLYATNINDGDYTLWRLENGGAQDRSKGIISSKGHPDKKYDVMLQWVTGKGWDPISVTLESKAQ